MVLLLLCLYIVFNVCLLFRVVALVALVRVGCFVCVLCLGFFCLYVVLKLCLHCCIALDLLLNSCTLCLFV